MTQDEWRAQATALFGPDPMDWKFVCPSCCHVASVRDWKDAGATEGEVAFSCIGRHAKDTDAADKKTFRKQGGPCTYAGGGLFRINPVVIEGHDNVFAFATVTRMTRARRHRALLVESLATAETVNSMAELVALVKKDLYPWGVDVEPAQVHVEPYGGVDERCGWDTHIVTVDGYGVWGFADGPGE